jgi:hypothetical protein
MVPILLYLNYIDTLNWFLNENIPIRLNMVELMQAIQFSDPLTIKWLINNIDPNQIDGLIELIDRIPFAGSVSLHEFMITIIYIIANTCHKKDISNMIDKEYHIPLNMRIVIPFIETAANILTKYIKWKANRDLEQMQIIY